MTSRERCGIANVEVTVAGLVRKRCARGGAWRILGSRAKIEDES